MFAAGTAITASNARLFVAIHPAEYIVVEAIACPVTFA